MSDKDWEKILSKVPPEKRHGAFAVRQSIFMVTAIQDNDYAHIVAERIERQKTKTGTAA